MKKIYLSTKRQDKAEMISRSHGFSNILTVAYREGNNVYVVREKAVKPWWIGNDERINKAFDEQNWKTIEDFASFINYHSQGEK